MQDLWIGRKFHFLQKQEWCIFEKKIMKTHKNILFIVYFNQFAVTIGITIAIGKGMQIHQVLFAHAA